MVEQGGERTGEERRGEGGEEREERRGEEEEKEERRGSLLLLSFLLLFRLLSGSVELFWFCSDVLMVLTPESFLLSDSCWASVGLRRVVRRVGAAPCWRPAAAQLSAAVSHMIMIRTDDVSVSLFVSLCCRLGSVEFNNSCVNGSFGHQYEIKD